MTHKERDSVEREPTNEDARSARLYGFDFFWRDYPKRNGRLIGKKKAEDHWAKLSLDEKRAAHRGGKNYAADVNAGKTIAMDPFRWLRDRLWEDWQGPAEPSERPLTVVRPEIEYDPDEPGYGGFSHA